MRLRRPALAVQPPSPAVAPAQAGVATADLKMPAAFDALEAPPLFLCGVARSGKTFTFDLFANHPEVCGIFESWLLTYHSGLTGVFHQPQWHEPFYERQREQIGHPHAATQLVSYTEMAGEIGDMLAGWLMRAVQPGQKYLVEATPMDIEALTALFPEAKLIHVMRDGRDVVGSTRRAARSWAPEMDKSRPVAADAALWNNRLTEMRAAAVPMGDNYRELRFEDLRADLPGVMTELLEWAGIPVTDDILQTMAGSVELDRYPDSTRASGFRGAGAHGGYRGWMTRRQGREFDQHAGELLVDLGYESTRHWWKDLPRRAGSEPVRVRGRRQSALLKAFAGA